MDKFEKIEKQMEKMSKEEATKKINTLKMLCTCQSCPTYTECAGMEKELLFCTLTKSQGCIILKGNECICPDCPVKDEIGLKSNFYCIRNSEAIQRGLI